jgi:endonuclease YncB( thermonuclease family)
MVRGRVRKAPIDNKNRITIRLQGVDAPELHFRPVAPTINGKKPTLAQKVKFKVPNGNFRQHFGETSTTALHQFLSKVGPGTIPCVVRTAVDEPSDVFDTFGRFVGDIFTTGYYSWMSNQEINDITAFTEKARKTKIGIWKRASSDLTSFDRSLLFRLHGQPDPLHDPGPVILSKLFRRRSTFGVAAAAKLISGSLTNYLRSHPDHCFHTDEFLAEGPTAATPHTLDEFVSTTNIFSPAPKDLVFKEDPAQVLGKNGKPAQW